MIENLSHRELKVFIELLKNARISDRDLASKLGFSQPTVTRMRNKLFEKGFIQKYSVSVNPSMVGLNLLVFTFVRITHFEVLNEISEWLRLQDSVVFAAEGEGLREYQMVVISSHHDFNSYEGFLSEFRKEFHESVGSISSFFSSSEKFVKDFSVESSVQKFIYQKVYPPKPEIKKEKKAEPFKLKFPSVPRIPKMGKNKKKKQ